MRLKVVTAGKSRGIGDGLTYESDDQVAMGTPVKVPLRRSIVEGIVLGIHEAKEAEEFDVKRIQNILCEKPLLNEAQMKTLHWMADYYCCSLRACLSVWLPPPPWSKLLPRKKIVYQLVAEKAVHGKKQRAIVEFLKDRERASSSEVQTETGASGTALKSLVKAGVVREITLPESEERQRPPSFNAPILTHDQMTAAEAIWNDRRPSLLFGITGSGKTEVYADLIVRTLRRGKRAILLVPEILLTENSIERFEKLLDRSHIAVLHSRRPAGERVREWRRIHEGHVWLVIGSRSALFAPVTDLGLVIIDEEHEWTYKNEQMPRYHARETAETLARFAEAKLLLGTATPSIESWSRAKEGRYHTARLEKRYLDQPLPDVSIVDLGTVKFGSLYPFSPPLLEAIEERLKRGEQSVLFLNRRGSATALLCLDCRRRVVSPVSQLPFTVHTDRSGKPFLMDHLSGVQAPLPEHCPHCSSSNLFAVGAGTQKIESILGKVFPSARVLRADSDTLTSPEQMRLLLKKMREGQADILLGTQSVVKGLDLPNVTLAAVLLADVGLSLPHFRAGERVFQLLTQLTGRSGRAKPGQVIIQTFRPEAEEVKRAARHEVEEFLDQEWKLRLHMQYPPAVSMIRFILRGNNARLRGEALKLHIEELSRKKGQEIVMTSSPMLMAPGAYHVLVRGFHKDSNEIQAEKYGAIVDVDPIECF